jgi:hypothetical protein
LTGFALSTLLCVAAYLKAVLPWLLYRVPRRPRVVSPFDRLSAGVRDPYAGDLDTPLACIHGFAPHCCEPVANKAGKQLGREPMGQQNCLCEAVRRVGEYPERAAPFRAKAWL